MVGWMDDVMKLGRKEEQKVRRLEDSKAGRLEYTAVYCLLLTHKEGGGR